MCVIIFTRLNCDLPGPPIHPSAEPTVHFIIRKTSCGWKKQESQSDLGLMVSFILISFFFLMKHLIERFGDFIFFSSTNNAESQFSRVFLHCLAKILVHQIVPSREESECLVLGILTNIFYCLKSADTCGHIPDTDNLQGEE